MAIEFINGEREETRNGEGSEMYCHIMIFIIEHSVLMMHFNWTVLYCSVKIEDIFLLSS